MKKIYFLLVFVLLLGFVGLNKASGQEDCPCASSLTECIAPCQRITFDLPYECNGETRSSRVTICHYCYITRNESCYQIIQMLDIDSKKAVPRECESALQAKIADWVAHHSSKYCGTIACNEAPTNKIKLIFPVCANMNYKGNGIYDISLNPDCDLRCVWELEMCWCPCIPPCDGDPECPTPHVKWSIVNAYTLGNGTCNPTNLRPDCPPTVIQCQRFETLCYPNTGWEWDLNGECP